jgi:hypothetical protein
LLPLSRFIFIKSAGVLPPEPLFASGVGQPAIASCIRRDGFPSIAFAFSGSGDCDPVSDVVGQPNKPEPLSDMRRTDARSAQICRPNGVSRCFHVSAYKVEPTETVLARNLLSKDDWRAALADEVMPVGPQVPLIIKPASCTCRAERLARAASCPNGAII